MSKLVDKIFAEVCLDERITDGIFRMEEEEHMNALRDYFVKKGISESDAINVTNRMVEGKYPERQAYRKEDGILVTWPSPQHKKKAMQENPGKYIEQNPFPKKEEPPVEKEPPMKAKDETPEEEPEEEPEDKSAKPASNLFSNDTEKTQTNQTGKELAVEPPRGDDQASAPPAAPQTSSLSAPKTPEKIAAEKEVVKQMMNTDDSNLLNVTTPLNEECIRQLTELYQKADELGYKEAVTFLTRYVKS